MDKVLDKSLVDALSWASIRELGPVDDGENIWILALALVSKRDGTKSYIALSKDEKGEDKIVKDFGNVSQIVKIEEVYPYLYLDASYVPDFKGQKKEDKVKWLLFMNPKGNYEDMTAKELNKAILGMAVKNHLRDIKNIK